MRTVITFLCGLALVLFFSSCQKEFESDPGTSSPSFKVKTYTEDIKSTLYGNSITTYNLGYDGNDRIVSVISALSPGDKFVYQYNGNSSYTLDIYNSGVLSIHVNFFINSSLLMVDSTLQYNGSDTTTEKYIYNANGQLIAKKTYDYSTVTGAILYDIDKYKCDVNGNVISDTNNQGVTTYTFYSNLSNAITLGQFYFYQNKNLVKTTTRTSGGSAVKADHTYTFDSYNRLSTEKIESDNGDVVIKTYTYY